MFLWSLLAESRCKSAIQNESAVEGKGRMTGREEKGTKPEGGVRISCCIGGMIGDLRNRISAPVPLLLALNPGPI